MVAINIKAGTGNKERRRTGMEFLIYLARAAIHLLYWWKSNFSLHLNCRQFDLGLKYIAVFFIYPSFFLPVLPLCLPKDQLKMSVTLVVALLKL